MRDTSLDHVIFPSGTCADNKSATLTSIAKTIILSRIIRAIVAAFSCFLAHDFILFLQHAHDKNWLEEFASRAAGGKASAEMIGEVTQTPSLHHSCWRNHQMNL